MVGAVPRLALFASLAAASGLGCAGAPYVTAPLERSFQRGVALGFVDARAGSAAPGGALATTLREVRALGASDVSIVVPLYTEGLSGTRVWRGALDDADGRETSPTDEAMNDAALRRVIAAAHAAGQRVMIFPIVRLRVRAPGEWRGKLRPVDRDAWFASYAAQVVALAQLCAGACAERLAIGSELVSFEDDPARWRALAATVRGRYAGKLLYSANWDRYRAIGFWDAVDEVGVSAYFSLAARGEDPSVPALVAAWRPIVAELAAFSAAHARPIVFTEVGFPSVQGAAYWPWNDGQSKTSCAAGEGCEGERSMEAQRRLWAAFVSVFSARDATSFLAGTYVWLWVGAGGLRDRGYSPRGKPAQAVLELWYRAGSPSPMLH